MINNQKGYTLVEVLASMVILFIILMTFFGVFSQSALFTQVTEESLQATTLANRVMDEIRLENCLEKQCLSLVDVEGHFIEAPLLKLTIEDPELDPELELVLVSFIIENEERQTTLAQRYLYLNIE